MCIFIVHLLSQNQLCKIKDEDTFLFRSSSKRHRLQAQNAAGMSLFLLGLLELLCKKKKKNARRAFWLWCRRPLSTRCIFRMLLVCFLPMKEAPLSKWKTVQLLPDGVRWGKETCPYLSPHYLWWHHHILPRKVQALSIKLASSGFPPFRLFAARLCSLCLQFSQVILSRQGFC